MRLAPASVLSDSRYRSKDRPRLFTSVPDGELVASTPHLALGK
jgi:hypothetical protein